MSRVRLTIGTFGDITRATAPGKFQARMRYRDWNWDGIVRQVQSTGSSPRAAEQALKNKLAERFQLQPIDTVLTPDSPFEDLVTYWLGSRPAEWCVSSSSLGVRAAVTPRQSIPRASVDGLPTIPSHEALDDRESDSFLELALVILCQ